MPQILVIEDNRGDAGLLEEAFKETKLMVELKILNEGADVLNYLRHKGKYSDSKSPEIILLDLNLPEKGGIEILKEIKSDPLLLHIPVVVLSVSERKEDICMAYSMHANAYLVKPIDLNRLFELVKCIYMFWIKEVSLAKG